MTCITTGCGQEVLVKKRQLCAACYRRHLGHKPRLDLPHGITRAEQEVLRLAATGLNAFDIADKLTVSKRTVDFHLNRIYRKFKVTNRTAAVMAAVHVGVIPGQGTVSA